MAVKAPPPPPKAAVATWTGFYAGVNIGYGYGNDPVSETVVSGVGFPIIGAGTPLYGSPNVINVRPQGVIGGGQIGYNFQVAPIWLAGLEADIQGSGMRDSRNCIVVCGVPLVSTAIFAFAPSIFSVNSLENKIQWFGTVRGRFGYEDGANLFYVTGGLAYGSVERNRAVVGTSTILGLITINNFAGNFSATSTNVGWTAGGGWERRMWGNWSVKAEYLYVDLGRTTDSFNTIYGPGSIIGTAGTVAAVRTDTIHYHENIVRVGLNYQFGG
jgi:outer membrane immunogenic protein